MSEFMLQVLTKIKLIMSVETFDKNLRVSECYVFNLRTTYHHDLIPLVEYNSEPSIPMPENARLSYLRC